MNLKYAGLILLLVLSFFAGISQAPKQENKFTISGTVVDRDTGRLVLWYVDDSNTGQSDTTQIINGKFGFTGYINWG